MLSTHAAISRSPAHVFCELAGEAVILSLADGRYYGLDPVGTHVWQRLEAPATLPELRDAVAAAFEVAPEQAEADLRNFVDDLRTRGLVDVVTPAGA
jgi:hypothetical protein